MSKYYSFDSCGIVTGKMFLSLIGAMSNENIMVKAKKTWGMWDDSYYELK